MIRINYADLAEGEMYQKNKLYRIKQSGTIQFREEHKDKNISDIVNLQYCIKEQQYGVFAHEYRNPSTCKQGGKSADVLACIIDEKNKKIYTTIFDVKHNISSFSDDLLKEEAILTAIKDVREFNEQIHAEILHKNSFLLFYKDEGYSEYEQIGIATTNFDSKKFIQVSQRLKQLLDNEHVQMTTLLSLKLKNNLNAYKNEVVKIKDFANHIIKIGDNTYEMKVFILKQINNLEYESTIQLSSDKEKF